MRVGPQRNSNRVAVHEVPKPAVEAHIVGLGHRIAPVVGQQRYDYLVDEKVRLALRVAFPSASQRRVRAGGRNYHYVYRAWNFNFHYRGKVGERYADFFVCIPLVPGSEVDLEQAFVIPWNAVSGKTFYLPGSRRPYAGRFARFRNGWRQLRDGPLAPP